MSRILGNANEVGPLLMSIVFNKECTAVGDGDLYALFVKVLAVIVWPQKTQKWLCGK